MVQAFLDLLQVPIHGGKPLGHSRITAARAYRIRVLEDALHERIELSVHLTSRVQGLSTIGLAYPWGHVTSFPFCNARFYRNVPFVLSKCSLCVQKLGTLKNVE